MMAKPLIVFETHPIQYHAPVYRHLQQHLDVPVTVIYGSDFSIAGYRDKEFGVTFSWDTDLLSGYSSYFLSRVENGGPDSPQALTGVGIPDILDQIGPSVVLLHGYHPHFHRAAFWYSKRRNLPLLLRAETTDKNQNRTIAKTLLRDTILRWYYRQFTALLPIGQNSQVHYQRLINGQIPMFLAPYCADTAPFALTEEDRDCLRSETRLELKLNQDDLVILFSGKLIDVKAPGLLLEGLKQLPLDFHTRIKVLFLGDGTLKDQLVQIAQTPPQITVQFLGFRNQTALSRYYHAADLLVLPSRSETWGLVVNEALHHGLPCVVSDRVGCASDLVHPARTGEIFYSGDATQLMKAITRANHLIGKLTVREECRAVVGNYSIAAAAQGIANAFDYAAKKC